MWAHLWKLVHMLVLANVTRTIGPRREFKEKFLKEEVKPKGVR